MKFKSVQTKIAVIAGVCLVILSSILVGYNLYSARSNQKFINKRVARLIEERSLNGLESMAGEYAKKIQIDFEVAIDAARTMADIFTVSKTSGPHALHLGRDEINAILLRVLQNNPDFNGTYSCWEPNALDGNDADFKTGRDGNNAITGRFTPYWNRDHNGKIAVQPLVEYDTQERHPNGVLKGGWYIGPRENRLESVLDPFPYIVQGKKVWLTTLSVPIVIDETFYGVAGSDYNLNFVQKLSENMDKALFKGQGEVIIISNRGLVVAYSEDPGLIGQHVKNVIGNEWQRYIEAIQAGENLARLDPEESHFKVITPITLGRTGKPWAVMIRIKKEAVLADAMAINRELTIRSKTSAIWQTLVGVGTCILVILILWYAAGGIVRPIRRTVRMLKDIANGEGDLTKRLEVRGEDEVGEMATFFNLFMDKLQKLIRQIVTDSETLNASATDLSAISVQMTGRSESMAEHSKIVTKGSVDMSTNIDGVAAACEQTATNINVVATATEEMTATIHEIAKKSEESRIISQAALAKAGDASAKLDELGRGALEINKVTEVISAISSQINLLALNATIEAARAGEAGRGFAIVATEIKELAKQTDDATQQVKGQIENMQGSTDATVAEVEQILAIIEESGVIVSSITDAMEQQATTTQEIAENISQTSQGIQDVNHNINQGSEVIVAISNEITGVDQSAQEVAQASHQINIKAVELSELSEKLHTLVGQFRV